MGWGTGQGINHSVGVCTCQGIGHGGVGLGYWSGYQPWGGVLVRVSTTVRG